MFYDAAVNPSPFKKGSAGAQQQSNVSRGPSKPSMSCFSLVLLYTRCYIVLDREPLFPETLRYTCLYTKTESKQTKP